VTIGMLADEVDNALITNRISTFTHGMFYNILSKLSTRHAPEEIVDPAGVQHFREKLKEQMQRSERDEKKPPRESA
jgi:hypothetical protein